MADGGKLAGIDQAANIAYVGLDPLDFLYTRDPLRRNLLIELSNRVMRLKEIEQNNQAVRIAEKVGELFKRK